MIFPPDFDPVDDYSSHRPKIKNMIFPPDFDPVDDYSSHRPMLFLALRDNPDGTVLELGCGYGSTPVLAEMCKQQERLFISVDNNLEWANHFPKQVLVVDNWDHFIETGMPPCKVVFIDAAPGEDRVKLIKYFSDKAPVIIVHDTEQSAEYVYGMSSILNSFQYRCDLSIAGMPQTTAVSNLFGFEKWKEIQHPDYLFV